MKETVSQFPWTWLPITALLIFFAFFAILIVRVTMKSRQPVFREAGLLPLEDGEKL
jgi:hypothetical protein